MSGLAGGMAVGLVGSATSTQPARAAATTVDNLGAPLRDVLLIGGAVGPGPDGRAVIWSAVTGNPAHLAAVDPRTGQTISYQPLEGSPGSYAVVVAPDGSVYVGTYESGSLYRRRPGRNSPIENLGTPLPGETYIWRLAVDKAGLIYGGTSLGGKVFRYDPSTGAVRDYGPILAGNKYVRSIAVWNGKIYAGSQPDAHLFEIDAASGAMRELPLPPDLGPGTGINVYDLNAHEGRVYARFGGATSGRLGIWEVAHQRWQPLRDNVAGLDVSEPGRRGLVYYTRNGRLTGLNPRTGVETDTGLEFTGRVVNNRGIGWVTLAERNWPGRTLVGLLWRGAMFRYNPLTGRSDITQTDIPGEPIPLSCLSIAESGRMWAGGYLNGGVAQVDPDTGAAQFNRFSQTESVLDLGDTVWLGAYPDARLYRYDPAAPWNSTEYSPGPPGTAENPVKVVDLKAVDQVRARASTDAGRWVAYGTMPNVELGGALVVVDKATGTSRVHRPVVTDQSIITLTHASGLVIGGTSIHGGYSVPPPTQTEAAIFGFDPATDAKIFEVVPVSGATQVSGLVTDRDGGVWLLAGGQLCAFDVATRAVVRRVTVPAGTGRLGYHAASDMFYVLAGGTLASVSRTDLTVRTVLQHPADILAVHPDGRVFLADGPTVYRVTLA
ncbi:hypothetical protein [Plantactinospora sp. GCM10030261]|uniref:hypothetical protein n=1 Tax=Plantactinospora sp. GCM10030261 TaxID=3273420 RepID=UPI0036135045